jgi:hypothetical protein
LKDTYALLRQKVTKALISIDVVTRSIFKRFESIFHASSILKAPVKSNRAERTQLDVLDILRDLSRLNFEPYEKNEMKML